MDALLRFESMRELLDALALDARDPAVAGQSRRNFTIAGIGILVMGTLLARLAGHGSAGALLPSIEVLSCFLVATLALTFHFRRTLLSHPLHRVIVVGAVVWHVSLVLTRLLAILWGAGSAIIIAMDYVVMAAIGSMIAGLVLPRMWGLVPISLVAAVLSAAFPEHAVAASDVLVPALGAATLLLWAQAARAGQKVTAPGS